MKRLPKAIRAALDGCGLDWEIENGTKHAKVRLAGRFVTILPHGKGKSDPRIERNKIAQIRQSARQIKQELENDK